MTVTVTYSKDRAQNCAQNELKCIPQIEETNKQQTHKIIYYLMKIPITQTVTYSKDRGQNCAQKELKCISTK